MLVMRTKYYTFAMYKNNINGKIVTLVDFEPAMFYLIEWEQ